MRQRGPTSCSVWKSYAKKLSWSRKVWADGIYTMLGKEVPCTMSSWQLNKVILKQTNTQTLPFPKADVTAFICLNYGVFF